MNDHSLGPYFQIVLLLGFLVPMIFFFLTQQQTLKLIHPLNRCMPPERVWLQLIPLFGLVWQFLVIIRISDSIRKELNTPTGDSIFAETSIPADHRPTYIAGMLYAALFCISVVPGFPFLKGIAALAAMAAWIGYWVQLSGYKKQLEERAKR